MRLNQNKNLLYNKDIVNKVKNLVTVWEKIFATYMKDKDLIFITYKLKNTSK